MSKMQSFVPLVRVTVARDGKRVRPTIGEPFEFTEQEVDDLRKMEKTSGRPTLRELVTEVVKPLPAKKGAKAAAPAADGDGL